MIGSRHASTAGRRAGTALALVACGAALGVRSTAAQDNPGKAAYAKVCAECHGLDAQGGQGPALVPFSKELPELVAIVRQGVGLMPAIPRDRITDDDIARVREYLISLSQSSPPRDGR